LIILLALTNLTSISNTITSHGPLESPKDFFIGVQADDWLGLKNWGGFWSQVDPLEALSTNGVSWNRVGVRFDNNSDLQSTDSWCSVYYSAEVLRASQENGMNSNLFFFLSHMPAHAGQQPCPPWMENMSINEKAQALNDSCFFIVDYYQSQGIEIGLYDAGNEIDFGIVDERPPIDGSVDWFDTNWLKSNTWASEATMLKGAIAGIKRADPDAKIQLHMAISNRPSFVREFFQFMLDRSVPFDFAGLSFYPTWQGDNEQATFSSLKLCIEELTRLDLDILITEYAYPSAPSSTMAEYNKAVDEYPLTDEGQARFIEDFLRWVYNFENLVGAFYYAPDYHLPETRPDLESAIFPHFSVFHNDYDAKPSLKEFRKFHSELCIFNSIDTNLSVHEFTMNESANQLRFIISSSDNSLGYCNVTFPREILPNPYRVMIDGNLLDFSESHNESFSSIYFETTGSSGVIVIAGNLTQSYSQVDDFLVFISPVILATLVFCLGAFVILRKKKEGALTLP